MGAPKDSTALLIGNDEMAPGAVDSHLIGAKDRFSELGIPLISRRLAFQGLDIDPYLRYALQVDVANVMKELGELLGLESSEPGFLSPRRGVSLLSPRTWRVLMLRVRCFGPNFSFRCCVWFCHVPWCV